MLLFGLEADSRFSPRVSWTIHVSRSCGISTATFLLCSCSATEKFINKRVRKGTAGSTSSEPSLLPSFVDLFVFQPGFRQVTSRNMVYYAYERCFSISAIEVATIMLLEAGPPFFEEDLSSNHLICPIILQLLRDLVSLVFLS